jgi:hypothetical protein
MQTDAMVAMQDYSTIKKRNLVMIVCLVLLMATSQLYAASTSDPQVDLGPVKARVPSELVCSTLQSMFARAITVATAMNNGNKLTGLINVPYQEIATKGYLAYNKEHPEMMRDAAPLIAHVNADTKVQALWALVRAAKSPLVRLHTLSMFLEETAQPLARQQEQLMPTLQYAPHMAAIMFGNQELELSPAQQAGWNAIFATTASIMQAIETEDRKAFRKLFEHDAPSRCVLM